MVAALCGSVGKKMDRRGHRNDSGCEKAACMRRTLLARLTTILFWKDETATPSYVKDRTVLCKDRYVLPTNILFILTHPDIFAQHTIRHYQLNLPSEAELLEK